MPNPSRPLFPFTALVGQEQMKRALLLNAANPRLGGVLIRGQKGTAKSTAVRALAALLPEIEVVADCPFNCDPHGGPYCPRCQERLQHGPLPARQRRAPMVDLPLGATEDRVVGTLDLERALQSGERRFEPGLLAAANRGVLYVDEVNLLGDHLVDVLLDAASLGVNYVEREGLSYSHPAQFILVGTMNPEEGDLRPQLLDRFALAVEVEGLPQPRDRAEVVRRRVAFEADPAAFAARWDEAESAERDRLRRARALLPRVSMEDGLLDLIAHLCASFEVDGLRADIVTYKAALTLAAYAGRDVVLHEDIRAAAELALLHRRRRQPFEQPGLDHERLDRAIQEHRQEQQRQSGRDGEDGPAERDKDDSLNRDGGSGSDASKLTASTPEGDAPQSGSGVPPAPRDASRAEGALDTHLASDVDGAPAAVSDSYSPLLDLGGSAAPERVDLPAASPTLRLSASPPSSVLTRGRADGVAGRARRVRALDGRGAYVATTIPRGEPRDLALDATLRAAAPHQCTRRLRAAIVETSTHPESTTVAAQGGSASVPLLAGSAGVPLLAGSADVPPASPDRPLRRVHLERHDLRQKVRESRVGRAVLFIVDASGSMAAQRRMAAVKGAILALLLDAYQRRDQVGLIAFRGASAQTLLPLSASVDLAEARLRVLPTGGRTPLAHGLHLALQTVRRLQWGAGERRPLLVLVTDGRANVPLEGATGDALADARRQATLLAALLSDVLVVDTERGPAALGLARDLARRLGARHLTLDELAPDTLVDAVRRHASMPFNAQ